MLAADERAKLFGANEIAEVRVWRDQVLARDAEVWVGVVVVLVWVQVGIGGGQGRERGSMMCVCVCVCFCVCVCVCVGTTCVWGRHISMWLTRI